MTHDIDWHPGFTDETLEEMQRRNKQEDLVAQMDFCRAEILCLAEQIADTPPEDADRILELTSKIRSAYAELRVAKYEMSKITMTAEETLEGLGLYIC
jgi:hypothetical protein